MAIENLEQGCKEAESQKLILPGVCVFYKNFYPSEKEKQEQKRAIEVLRKGGFFVNTIPVNRIDSFHDVPVQAQIAGAYYNGLESIRAGVKEYNQLCSLIKTLHYLDLEKVRELVRELKGKR